MKIIGATLICIGLSFVITGFRLNVLFDDPVLPLVFANGGALFIGLGIVRLFPPRP